MRAKKIRKTNRLAARASSSKPVNTTKQEDSLMVEMPFIEKEPSDCEDRDLRRKLPNVPDSGPRFKLRKTWNGCASTSKLNTTKQDKCSDLAPQALHRNKVSKDDKRNPLPDFSGHIKDFNIPPDGTLEPEKIGVGCWVYTVFRGCGGLAVRGIITNRHKQKKNS